MVKPKQIDVGRAANVKFIRGSWRRQSKLKNEHLAGIFSAIFPLVGFLLRGNCRNQYVSTRIHVSLFCILLDLYFMSEMRSRSVSNQKEYCTKSVHVRILYIIRVNFRNQYICTHFLISRFLNFILNLHLWIF